MSENLKPVAYRYMDVEENFRVTEYPSFAKRYGFDVVPLYAIPEGYAILPIEASAKMEFEAEAYWDKHRLKMFSKDPRTWAGLYAVMIAAAQEETK